MTPSRSSWLQPHTWKATGGVTCQPKLAVRNSWVLTLCLAPWKHTLSLVYGAFEQLCPCRHEHRHSGIQSWKFLGHISVNNLTVRRSCHRTSSCQSTANLRKWSKEFALSPSTLCCTESIHSGPGQGQLPRQRAWLGDSRTASCSCGFRLL